jgi:SufBD protein N-terminal region
MSVSTPQDEYQHGFVSAVDNKSQLVGLSEEVVRKISKSRNEPEWLLEFRLDAYAQLQKMTEPQWSEIKYDLDLDTTIFLATQKRPKAQSLSEIDPEILKTYDRLGIPLEEQKRLSGVAVDAVFDSTSVFTTYRKQLAEIGVIFCSFADAVQDYPELVARYLGSVVPSNDNYFTCLNSAVFSDGSFVFVPQGVQCPMDLTSYFRINTEGLGDPLDISKAAQRHSSQLLSSMLRWLRLSLWTMQVLIMQQCRTGIQETSRGKAEYLTLLPSAAYARVQDHGLAGHNLRLEQQQPGNIQAVS